MMWCGLGKDSPKMYINVLLNIIALWKKLYRAREMYQGKYQKHCVIIVSSGDIDSCVELCENPVWKLTKDEKISYFEKLIRDKYIQERLKNYSGNVPEIEDIIKPILDRRADKIVTVLKKRTFKEALRKTDTVQILRKNWEFSRKSE